MKRRKSPRGAYRRRDCIFIGTWVPQAWIPVLDAAVASLDADRSKLVRKAIASVILKQAA